MKIAFLITYFHPIIGGAENNCYFLAKELAKKHEVHVFTSREKNTEEKIGNIKVHGCQQIFRYKYYLAFYPSLIKKMLKEEFDIVHVHGFGFIQHDLVIKAYKRKYPKTKIICTPHGPFMALKKYSFFQECFKGIYTRTIKNALKSYDKIIQVNPSQERWMQQKYGISKEKIEFLPNGIMKDTFKKVSEKQKTKVSKKYNLKNRFIISYLGRIQEYKGVETVIKTLPALKKIQKDILFLVIGRDAGDTERLKRLSKKIGCEKNVLFTGEVSEEEKIILLDFSEIFVFPSQWEAFGIVVLEAMARKNAIISTKTEGGLYLINEGENGFLYDYKNTKQLASRISRLIEDHKLRKRLQENNLKKSKQFLWKDIAKNLEEIYFKLQVKKK